MSFGWKLAAVLVGVVLYFVPCYIALERQHHLRRVICVVNILLGWTVIGWVVALAMALSGVKRRIRALDDYFGD